MTDGTIKTLEIPSTDCKHKYGEWTQQLEATCTCAGYSSRVCSICGDTEYDIQKPTEHKLDKEPLVVMEYKDSGKSFGIYFCSECNALIKQDINASEGLDYNLSDSMNSYKLVGIGSCTDKDIIIPETYNGLPVTEIGEKAFYGCETITSVYIPECVISIGNKAFSDCKNLESVDMHDNVDLGQDVFRGSITVIISTRHNVNFVSAKDSSCSEAGNIEHYLCSDCGQCFADAECKERLYDVSIPPKHSFVSGVCNKCGTVENSVLIAHIDSVGHLGKFALGTLESAIGLPEKIRVQTADGNYHMLSVLWDMSGYNKAKVGNYTVRGVIQAGELHFTDGLSANIEATLEVTDLMKGTADIVFILDTSGSMGSEINTVKSNINTFAQKIEDAGVSVRWSLVTFSDFTCSSSTEEQTQIIKNGASNWYTSASECKNAISSITLASGGDTEETAIDGLLMANTLDNRKDARVFYILLTDATFKVDNHYGVSSMSQTVQILDDNNVNVSVITSTSCYSDYSQLTDTTGGILANITGNFANTLFEKLIPIIYEDVIA